MIEQLTGTVVQKVAPKVILDVRGVGYGVDTPMSTFCQLPALGESLTLLTHFIVREDAHLLFGFMSEAERLIFRALLKVTGIGPKAALSVLSTLSPEQVVQAVDQQHDQWFVKVPGIGKKTAQRLVLELKDRLSAMMPAELEFSMPIAGETTDYMVQSEVENALLALGYKASNVKAMLADVQWDGMTVETAIKHALKQVAPA